MADPLTLTAISVGSTLIGGGVSAFGAASKGAADKAMFGYQAGVAELNAKIAKQNADYTREAGGTVAYQSGLKTGQVVGQQKVAQSASGIDVNTGSSATVRADTTKLGQLDQQTIRENYAKKAYGFEVEAATKSAEAGANLVAGQQASKAAGINVASSILGTVSSVSSKWMQGSQAGIFGNSGSGSGIKLFNENQDVVGYG